MTIEKLVDLPHAARLLDAADSVLLAVLNDQGVIRASGPDTLDFLQNLLSNDVKTLPEGEIRLAGFCTPKGRLLALFRLWRESNGDILLMLPQEILLAMLRKLSMYVLRSKVKLSDASNEFSLIGCASSQHAVLQRLTLAGKPAMSLTSTENPALALVPVPAAKASAVLATHTNITLEVWQWLEISAGLPQVLAATQEAFVPQMLNLELRALPGVSFSKGCYPGQEIVARTQYLGKIKRRMYRARLLDESQACATGSDVFAPETGDQHCGAIVSVAPAPDGSRHVLVCVQSGAVEAGVVTVGSPAGARLEFLDLPYALDGPDTRSR